MAHDLGEAASNRRWWKQAAPAGETVYRLIPPVVIWWAWVVFAVLLYVQAVISGHDYGSVELTAGLAAVTAILLGAVFRPPLPAACTGAR